VLEVEAAVRFITCTANLCLLAERKDVVADQIIAASFAMEQSESRCPPFNI